MTSNDMFADAFQNLRAGVLLVERDTGRVTKANPAFLRLCGRPRDAVVGFNFWAPPLIDDAAAGAEVFEHLRSGGLVEGAELPLRTASGSRLLLEISGGELAGGWVQLEVRDATMRAGARLAERMDAQRSLAARMTGEFSEMERTLGQSALPEAGRIRKAADHAAAIVRELRAYTGQQALVSRRFQLNELIEGMQPALQQILGRDIQLVPNLSPDVAPILAYPAQVRQIVLELAANSRDAMECGGTFRIATRNASPDDPLFARTDASSAYAILEVADSGAGFDNQSWDHLCEPFFTTKPHGKRGLGLAAVQGIVRQMGGRLWADSEPGKGAAFRIYLPMAQPESVAPPAPTILLMEQNDGLRTVMANILNKRGYRVLAASATGDALEMAKTQGPPDLLISEPEPDLAERLASAQPHLRTLFLNGHSDSAAGTPTLAKPFELETLLGKVRELLQV
jgi:two-component system cell cycle sensor histidine kinase/response regulator CckA